MSNTTHSRSSVVAVAATLAAAAFTAIGPAPTASAASLTVDTLSDNPADGYTLREAIDDANTNAGIDRIEFTDGMAGTITLTGGQLTSTGDLELYGPGVDQLTIDGGGAGRVLQSATAGMSLWLRDLTIANGAALGSGGGVAFTGDRLFVTRTAFEGNQASGQGGGLWVTNAIASYISIANSTFDNNRSGNAGGGLYLVNNVTTGAINVVGNSFVENESVNGNGGGAFISAPTRTVSVARTTASGNHATNGSAGGMWIDGGIVDVTEVTMLDNTAGTNFGGAMINANTGPMSATDVTFRNNSAANYGGGNISAFDDVTVSGNVIAENSSAGVGGLLITSSSGVQIDHTVFESNSGDETGALSISPTGSLIVEDSTFANNDGGMHGALAVTATPTTIIRSTFESNTADPVAGQGGAVYASASADIYAKNSTFHGNSAHDGGAIHGLGGSNVELFHVTMTENQATGEAGGVFVTVGANAAFVNSIVSDNTAPAFSSVNDTTLDINNSILGSSSGLLLNGAGFSVGVDPKLSPIADNGGLTRTLMPQPDSPAIDAAHNLIVMLPYVDQRGMDRLGAPDIGSVEVVAELDEPDPGDEPTGQPIWEPIEPARFVDTRNNGETIDDQFEAKGAFGNSEQRQIDFAGRGEVPADAVGVIANITAIKPSATGFVTAHPCENPAPNVASLNYTAGVDLGNEIILGLDSGNACIFTSAATHIAIDVVGYIPAPSPYAAIAPARYADTRAAGVTFDGANQGDGAPGAGQIYSVEIGGRGNVPANAVAAVMYVAAVNPEGNGFVTVWDCDGDPPLASSLNHVQGINRGNEIITEVHSDDKVVCFFTSANVDLTVDVVGYINDGTNFDAAENPSRLLDTRPGESTVDGVSAGDGTLEAGETVELIVAGRAGVPGLATTVSINVTVVHPTAPGFVTVYDCGTQPLASSLNYVPGVNGGNEIIASLNNSGKICLYSSADTHLTADVTGYTSP